MQTNIIKLFNDKSTNVFHVISKKFLTKEEVMSIAEERNIYGCEVHCFENFKTENLELVFDYYSYKLEYESLKLVA